LHHNRRLQRFFVDNFVACKKEISDKISLPFIDFYVYYNSCIIVIFAHIVAHNSGVHKAFVVVSQNKRIQMLMEKRFVKFSATENVPLFCSEPSSQFSVGKFRVSAEVYFFNANSVAFNNVYSQNYKSRNHCFNEFGFYLDVQISSVGIRVSYVCDNRMHSCVAEALSLPSIYDFVETRSVNSSVSAQLHRVQMRVFDDHNSQINGRFGLIFGDNVNSSEPLRAEKLSCRSRNIVACYGLSFGNGKH
jgi:hypothetical protein